MSAMTPNSAADTPKRIRPGNVIFIEFKDLRVSDRGPSSEEQLQIAKRAERIWVDVFTIVPFENEIVQTARMSHWRAQKGIST
jgi:hypothetical protein